MARPARDDSAATVLGFLAAAMAGALVAFLVFPAAMLLGSPSYWENFQGDSTTGVGAFYAFAHDVWRWPILYTPLYGSPEGSVIYFADPNPLLAIPAKLLFQATGILFLYMGPWLLACYMLNGGIGFLLLRHLRLPLLVALPASLLFVLMPAFLFRFPHLPLSGHFTVLATIYACLRITSGVRPGEILGWTLALGLLTLVTPYLLVMCAPLLFAALLDGWRRGHVSPKVIAASLIALGVEVVGLAWACGLFEGGSSPAGGFTNYSMNLLSPVWPQYSLFGWTPGILEGTPGQYEGFNYLGAGTLGLVALALVVARSRLWPLARDRAFYAVALAGLALFSMSSMIYAGHLLLVSLHYEALPVLSTFAGMFRAPGRFFWPVAYSALVAALVLLHRSKVSPWLPALVCAAVVVQSVELVPLYRYMREASAIRPVPDKDAIAAAIGEHTELRVFPGYLCTKPDGNSSELLVLQVVAARQGKPVDGVYVNRGDPGCERRKAEMVVDPFAGSTTQRPLLMIMKNYVGPQLLAAILKTGIHCDETSRTLLCARDRAPLDLAGSPPP